MKQWRIRSPRMLEGMNGAAFKPRSGLVLLIALTLYIAYTKLTVAGLAVYGGLLWLDGGWASLQDLLRAMLASQGLAVFSLLITSVLTALTIIYLVLIEKRPLATAGISRGRVLRRYAAGFGLGAAALLLCYAPPLVAELPAYRGVSPLVPVYLLAFIIQSSSEEVLFRGFMLTGIAKRTGTLHAVLISSALFSVAHALNGGYTLLGGVYYVLIGAFLALLMLRTGSLWASCGFHGAWNFTVGLLAPITVGGIRMDYALFDAGEAVDDAAYGLLGDPYYLVFIGVFAAAIAALLFVGNNRLVVRAASAQAARVG